MLLVLVKHNFIPPRIKKLTIKADKEIPSEKTPTNLMQPLTICFKPLQVILFPQDSSIIYLPQKAHNRMSLEGCTKEDSYLGQNDEPLI